MKQLKHLLGIWVRGVAMGAADVVPGVSGGTVAFITGIYEELLNSIKNLTPMALTILFKKGVKPFWAHINGNFLIALLLGILTSIALLARGIVYLLDNQPVLIWSFFFGLILSSAVWMLGQVKHWQSGYVMALLAGAGVAYVLTVISPAQALVTPLTVFLAGSVAICAMILPGISGSFLLLLMGMYSPVLTAIKSADVVLIGSFLGGCAVGILCFSHVLSWLFKRAHDLTIVVLIGFMVGSLNKVWPWKYTVSYRINSHGEQVPMMQDNILPMSYEHLSGLDPMIVPAVLLALLGVGVVFGIERVTRKK